METTTIGESIGVLIAAIYNALATFVTAIFTNYDVENAVVETTKDAEGMTGFLESLVAIFPTLIVIYALVKLLSSGLNVVAKVVSVLVFAAFVYLIFSHYIDWEALSAQNTFNW